MITGGFAITNFRSARLRNYSKSITKTRNKTQKKMNVQHRTSNVQHRIKNKHPALNTQRLFLYTRAAFLPGHKSVSSSFPIQRSMFIFWHFISPSRDFPFVFSVFRAFVIILFFFVCCAIRRITV